MVLAGTLITPTELEGWHKADQQPASYDIHLGPVVSEYTELVLDPTDPATLVTREIELPPKGWILQPGDLLLGHTVERVRRGGFAIQITSKSSLMRVGLQVGQGSWADPGFAGNLVLEMSPMSRHPVRIRPFMPIAQLVFVRVEGDFIPYHGKYQDQSGPQGARVG